MAYENAELKREIRVAEISEITEPSWPAYRGVPLEADEKPKEAEDVRDLALNESKGIKWKGLFNGFLYWVSWFVLPGSLLGFWFLSTSTFHWFNESQLPPPIQVWAAIKEMYLSGDLARHVSISLQRVLWGFLIGSALAIILGTVVGLWKAGERIFDPTLQGIRTVPSFAWVPFLLLWMGIDEPPKVTLIVIGTFFPVYLNLVSGIRNVDRKLVEVGQVFGLNHWQMVWRIFIPASLPSLVTGLRLGIGSSWLFLTAAELIASTQGLGYVLTDGQSTGRVDLMLVSILTLSFFGVLSDFLMRLIQLPVNKWNDSFKAG